eukprot:117852_1
MVILLLCWILPSFALASHDVLTRKQNIIGQSQCEKWNRNISTCSLTIEYMNDLMQRNAIFSYPTILNYVFDACKKLNTLQSDVFAGKAWDYITSHHPKHCMIEPYTFQYAKLLRVYWFATQRKHKKHSQDMMSHALQVVQHWITRSRNNSNSLSSSTMRLGVHNNTIFNQICTIIRNYKYWDVERKKHVILFYYQEISSLGRTLIPLQVIWNDLEHQQNGTQSRLDPHLKSFALQSIQVINPDLHQLYVTLYQQWLPKAVIHHFKEAIMGKQMVPNQELIAIVLDACCRTANVKLAEKIWKYTLSNRIKPNQIMFLKMLSVYQMKASAVMSDYNMYKCRELCKQWTDVFQTDRASLIQGMNLHQILALDFKLIPQQMIRIVLFKSRWEKQFKLQMANGYYNEMILLGILPDTEISLMLLYHY